MARVFDFLVVAGPAILAIKLFASGLYKRYRALFLYLIFAALRSGVLGSVSPSGKNYYHIWVLTEPVEWLFYFLVVFEIYSLVLHDYKGLATFGRWTLTVALGVALSASALGVLAPSHYTRQGPLMTYYYVADRAVYFSLVVFLITILGLLMQYPITLSRNILLHNVVFSVYFLANTVIYLMLSMLGPETISALRLACETVTLAAIAAWLVMLNPAGELRQQSLRPSWMPGREEELVSQLNNLNAALLRVTRK